MYYNETYQKEGVMDDIKRFWWNLKRQASENPILALAVTTALLTAVAKVFSVTVDMRNSHAWQKEVTRRAMNDALRRGK